VLSCYCDNREELFEKIKLGLIKFPSNFSPSLKDLLQGLFQKDPQQRLGGGAEGAKAIKSHPWFSGVDWNAYLRKEVRAPFIPVIRDELDVSNFDPEFTETAIESYKSSTFDKTYNSFEGFTYEGDNVLQAQE